MSDIMNQFLTAQKKESSSSSLMEVESNRAISEVQGAILMAKKFPRDMISVMDAILSACTRPRLAESALYSYSRGGSEITGPSIRLAEAIGQLYGNLQFGIRELEQNFGESTVEAFCWDIERNVRQVKIFKVKHVRNTKKGSYALEDGRDIYELVANNGARRLRACILGIIPGDVVETAVKQCEETLHTKIQITPEILKRMIEKFAEYGVSKEQIEKRIQRRIEAITPALMVQLGKISNSLKDGMSTPTDWFEPIQATEGEPQGGVAGLMEKIKKSSPKEKIEKEGPVSSDHATLSSSPQTMRTDLAKDKEETLREIVNPPQADVPSLSLLHLQSLKNEWGKVTRGWSKEKMIEEADRFKNTFGFTKFEEIGEDQFIEVFLAIQNLELKKVSPPFVPAPVKK